MSQKWENSFVETVLFVVCRIILLVYERACCCEISGDATMTQTAQHDPISSDLWSFNQDVRVSARLNTLPIVSMFFGT